MNFLNKFFDDDENFSEHYARPNRWLPVDTPQDRLYIKCSSLGYGYYWFIKPYLPYQEKHWLYSLYFNRRLIRESIAPLLEVSKLIQDYEKDREKTKDLYESVNPLILTFEVHSGPLIGDIKKIVKIVDMPKDLFYKWNLWQSEQRLKSFK